VTDAVAVLLWAKPRLTTQFRSAVLKRFERAKA
jgi:hypothetical protein